MIWVLLGIILYAMVAMIVFGFVGNLLEASKERSDFGEYVRAGLTYEQLSRIETLDPSFAAGLCGLLWPALVAYWIVRGLLK